MLSDLVSLVRHATLDEKGELVPFTERVQRLLRHGRIGGALLFLLASGLSLIFGVMRIVNLAHGTFYALGAYVSAWAVGRLLRAASRASTLVSVGRAALASARATTTVSRTFGCASCVSRSSVTTSVARAAARAASHPACPAPITITS